MSCNRRSLTPSSCGAAARWSSSSRRQTIRASSPRRALSTEPTPSSLSPFGRPSLLPPEASWCCPCESSPGKAAAGKSVAGRGRAPSAAAEIASVGMFNSEAGFWVPARRARCSGVAKVPHGSPCVTACTACTAARPRHRRPLRRHPRHRRPHLQRRLESCETVRASLVQPCCSYTWLCHVDSLCGGSWVPCRVGQHAGTSHSASHSCARLDAAGWIRLTLPRTPLPCSVFDNTGGRVGAGPAIRIGLTFRVGPAPARLASATFLSGFRSGTWCGLTASLVAVPAGQTLPANGPLTPLVTSTIMEQPPPLPPGALLTCARLCWPCWRCRLPSS